LLNPPEFILDRLPASTEEANKITNSLALKEAACTNAFTNEVVTGQHGRFLVYCTVIPNRNMDSTPGAVESDHQMLGVLTVHQLLGDLLRFLQHQRA
jgi:hypothetical protein